jgi:23S rRNA (cytosine1962-C5)-methyltransferase
MTPEAIITLQQHLLTPLNPTPAEACRLFHGRGKCWSGLEQISVDWLQGILLVTLFRQPQAAALAALKAMLPGLGQPVLLQHRYQQDCPAEWLAGEPVSAWLISEGGLRYQLDLGSRQNSGLFLDMRHGRRWVRQQAAGKSVLNLFAYTCGFSLAAIAGGARQVVNLDMARAALSRGRDNHRLNQQDLSRVTFLGHDLFKSWGKVKRLGPYDLIIIDPPSFQKGSFVLTSDYPKVLRRLPEMLNAQGIVLACCNDPDIGADFLLSEMAHEAPCLQFVERLDNPPEFADINPDGGLKAMVFQRRVGRLVQP